MAERGRRIKAVGAGGTAFNRSRDCSETRPHKSTESCAATGRVREEWISPIVARFQAAPQREVSARFAIRNLSGSQATNNRSDSPATQVPQTLGKRHQRVSDCEPDRLPHSSTNGCAPPFPRASQFEFRQADLPNAAIATADSAATSHPVCLPAKSRCNRPRAPMREFDDGIDQHSKRTRFAANRIQSPRRHDSFGLRHSFAIRISSFPGYSSSPSFPAVTGLPPVARQRR